MADEEIKIENDADPDQLEETFADLDSMSEE